MLKHIKKFFNSKKKSHHFENFYFQDQHSSNTGISSYQHNVIVNRCVNIIAQSAGHVPWVVMKKTSSGFEKILFHPISKLLKKPNPMKAGAEFFAEIIANKLLFGNSYILAISNHNKLPAELHSLNPQSVEVLYNQGIITGYRYISNNSKEDVYHINQINKQCQILHLKNYHPTDSIQGMSCLDPASKLIELHNKATDWNHTLLQNGARPSGALIVDGHLSDEQFCRLRDTLEEKYYGNSNAGKPMLLEGGLDWKEMSISPKDMDFIESRNSAAREIALAFGVPPQLLGINGDNTYSNMQEARLALWEETLIPLLDKIADGLTNWLSFWFNDEITIDFDRDSISVLTEKRQKLWSSLNDLKFMSINEKRAMANLPPIKNGDQVDA